MPAKPYFLDAADYPRALKVVGEGITVLASGDATGSYEIFLQDGIEESEPGPHAHPWDESFFIVKGEVDFDVGDEKTHTAVAGTLVHIPSGTLHWFRWKAGGGAMISITSRLGASRLFSDMDRDLPAGPRNPQKIAEVLGRHGVTFIDG